MPQRNGTGPMGQGPMTGWGNGFCNPSNTNNQVGNSIGRGRGYGRRGMGRGRFGSGMGNFQFQNNNRWLATGSKEQELDELKQQAQYLLEMVNQIQQRISEVEAIPEDSQ